MKFPCTDSRCGSDELRTADCGSRECGCGLSRTPGSSIRNPQSAIRDPKSSERQTRGGARAATLREDVGAAQRQSRNGEVVRVGGGCGDADRGGRASAPTGASGRRRSAASPDGALSREAPMRCALSSCASSTTWQASSPPSCSSAVIDTGTLPVITSSANSARPRLWRRARSTNQQRRQNWRKAGRLQGWRAVQALRAFRPYAGAPLLHWTLSRGSPPHRRHLRAVPPLLRPALRERCGRPGGRGGARRRRRRCSG